MSVETGEMIPPFSLPASTGQTLDRDAYLGKMPMVIFFLPDPESETDRSLLAGYDRLLKDFGQETSQVMGVARITARQARDLSDEMDLSLPLLADAGGDMARRFGVADPDGAVHRVTFVVDRHGKVARRFDPASASKQAPDMLEAIRALKTEHLEWLESVDKAEAPG
ncbi:MAG: redoxin domain-containing protein [Acidimicrobiia bacterium]